MKIYATISTFALLVSVACSHAPTTPPPAESGEQATKPRDPATADGQGRLDVTLVSQNPIGGKRYTMTPVGGKVHLTFAAIAADGSENFVYLPGCSIPNNPTGAPMRDEPYKLTIWDNNIAHTFLEWGGMPEPKAPSRYKLIIHRKENDERVQHYMLPQQPDKARAGFDSTEFKRGNGSWSEGEKEPAPCRSR